MKFLLKIVQGPNAGAEIALVPGVRVTLGSSDACDIVLADPTLPAEACSVETTDDAVLIALPGGEAERLEPLHVRRIGSTALAVGPADSPWGPLVEEPPPAPPAAPAAAEAEPEPPPKPDAAPAESAPEPARPRRRGWRLGCLLLLLLLLLLLAGAVLWLLRTPRGRAVATRLRGGETPAAQTLPPDAPDPATLALSAVSAECGLTLTNRNGRPLLVGNFQTRAERLAATARAYDAMPSVALDLSDDQSLLAAAEETLALLGPENAGTLRVAAATNRVVALSGTAPSAAALRATLEALAADVPHLANVDTSRAELATPLATAAPKQAAAPAGTSRASTRAAARAATPALPVCSILTTPYPCLVLRDGRRVLEGASFGEHTVLEIHAGSVVVTNSAGRFTWKP